MTEYETLYDAAMNATPNEAIMDVVHRVHRRRIAKIALVLMVIIVVAITFWAKSY